MQLWKDFQKKLLYVRSKLSCSLDFPKQTKTLMKLTVNLCKKTAISYKINSANASLQTFLDHMNANSKLSA
jgi:hypothetical protein